MEKRIVFAVALSILIILSFQFLVGKPSMSPPRAAAPEQKPQAAPAADLPVASYVQPKPSVEEKETEVETGRYILTFSNIGGAIKNIKLKEYKELKSKEPLGLAHITNPKEYLFNMSSLPSKTSLDLSGYKIIKGPFGLDCSIRTDDLEITKKYTLHNSKNIIELQIFVKNISGEPKKFNYRIIGGAGVSETSEQDKRLIEVTSKINGKIVNFKRPKNETVINYGQVDWAALKNKYFSLIFKPLFNAKGQFYNEDRDGLLVMGIESADNVIEPNQTIENKFLLYAGPSQIHVLKEIGHNFEETINYGFFGGISKILIFVMRFFHNIIRSWGISIILLSIFLNIILYPLTMKSFRSMQKMQELHPQMEKLKSQHKDNPQKLNKEIMELYKKYNINPFSGCLPLILQMPIFIALYQALLKSVELRGASFLWINDLSSPDAVGLPAAFPIIGNSVNILPLLMVAAMVIQQKISAKTMGSAVTDEQRQQQKMMLIVMPIVFGFIFYNMPSGLVLYWIVNTILTTAEQLIILKKA